MIVFKLFTSSATHVDTQWGETSWMQTVFTVLQSNWKSQVAPVDTHFYAKIGAGFTLLSEPDILTASLLMVIKDVFFFMIVSIFAHKFTMVWGKSIPRRNHLDSCPGCQEAQGHRPPPRMRISGSRLSVWDAIHNISVHNTDLQTEGLTWLAIFGYI